MNKKFFPVAVAAIMTQSIEGIAKSEFYCLGNPTVVSYTTIEPKDSLSSIEKVVKETVALQLHIDKSIVQLKSNLTKDLGADSLDIVEIVLQLEDKYGFEFSNDELNGLKTVSNLVTVIETRKKKIVK